MSSSGLIDQPMGPRYGIFGGTFDPPHLGHLILAAEALYQLRLDRLLWVLTPDPPHKGGQPLTPLPQRLALLEAALEDAPEFELSRVDIDRPSPHHSLDMVRILQEENPGAGLIYLMGGDSFHDLPNWHMPAEFLAACHGLGVMRRLGDELDLDAVEARLPGVREKTLFIDAPLLEIASHQIRQRVAEGAPYRYYLHPKVYALIRASRLYHTPEQ